MFENPPDFGLLSGVRKLACSYSTNARGQSSEQATRSHVRGMWW